VSHLRLVRDDETVESCAWERAMSTARICGERVVREFTTQPSDNVYQVEWRSAQRQIALGLIRVSCAWEDISGLVRRTHPDLPKHGRIAAWRILEREGRQWGPVLDAFAASDVDDWVSQPTQPIRDLTEVES